MSLRFINAAMLNTDSNSVIGVGQDKASAAFRLRINGPLPLATTSWNGTALMARSGLAGFGVTVTSVDVAAQTVRISLLWKTNTGTSVSASAVLSPGIVYALAMTYDKDDPSAQAVYSNGVKTLMTPSQSNPLGATATTLQMGNNGGSVTARDFSLEDLMWWNGHVLSLAEVFHVMDGSADPASVGLSASWRGWWQFDGTPGTSAANGQGSLANQIDGSWPFKTASSGSVSGTSLVYGDPMPFVSQAAYDAPIVCSSGKVIRVPTKAPSGSDLQVSGYGPSNPTVKINGGSAIELVPALSETHFGAAYFLPEGEKITPGQPTTFSGDDGFLVTGLGVVPASTDLACVNKSGVALYADQPRTLIGGLNFTGPGNTYYSYYQGTSNWAWRLIVDLTKETPSTVRSDGTLKVNRSGILLATTNFDDQIDNLSYPMPTGLWLVKYVPKDAGRATDGSLSSVTPGCCSEQTAYRNNGSVAGDPVYKVFETIETADYPNTLAGAVDASTTSIPLANTTNLQPRSASTGKPIMWLKVDDEYMIVEAINLSTKVATVTRGEFGSTPAAHASGASCFTRYYNQNSGLKFNITGPSGQPNYSDLVIYGPGDWTPPDPPAPVTDVDTSLAAQLRPTKFIRDSMVNNGIVRTMDSTMGLLQQQVEPEYMRLPTDLYHGQDAKFLRDFRITDLKPFDPEITPYLYLHYPNFPGSETYSATLAYAIDAVQTTFTISDAATAPVIEGSRLIAGSEIMRVTAVSGTTVTAVRGCMGTTAASHASGTITVGWRVPFTSTDQYQGTNQVAIDLTTDVPHRLRTGMWADDPAKIDLNPLAHGTVTLAADAVAGTKTITITASDWTYIKVGLYIQLGTDKPTRIATYDEDTGVCTLDYVVDTDHPAGTVGQTMSGGVWCKSLDGSTHAWSPNQGIVCFYYVTGANRLLVKFYVNLGGAVGVVDGDQTWDQTATVVGGSDQSQVHFKSPVQVFPYEFAGKVAALNPGSICWLNVYINASDDAARDAAIRVRDNLPSGVGHKVVVELGNEIWNPSFPFPYLLQGLSPIAGATTTNWIDAWVLRTKRVHQVVKDAFAESGHDADVLLSLPYQTGAMSVPLARARALGVDVDVVSTAPYYAPAYSATAAAAFEAADLDQAMDLWLFDYECNATTGTGRLIRDIDNPSRLNHEALTGRPLLFLTYEGGYKSMLPVPPNGTTDTSVYAHGLERNLDMSYTPNCYLASQDRLSVDQRNGVDGFTFFNHCQPPAKLTEGTGFYHEMWGLTPHNGQLAGRGDGSDGKADNRLTLATPGLPDTKGPLVNLHGSNVSTRLGAKLGWDAARVAGDDGGGGDAEGPATTLQVGTFGHWYRGSLQLAASATGSGHFGHSYRGSLAVAPAVFPSASYVEAMTGGISFGGSSAPAYAFVERMTGGVTFGGVVSVSVDVNPLAHGSFGHWYRGAVYPVAARYSSGHFEYSYRGSLAVAPVIIAGAAVAEEMSGGVSFGGTSAWSYVASPGMSGGVSFGGTSAVASAYLERMTGGISFGGVSDVGASIKAAMTGGVRFGGSSGVAAASSRAMTGGVSFGGSSQPVGSASYNVAMTGGVSFGGASTVASAYVERMTGGIRFGGTSAAGVQRTASMTGGVRFGGSSAPNTEQAPIEMTGGISFGGTSKVSSGTCVIRPDAAVRVPGLDSIDPYAAVAAEAT